MRDRTGETGTQQSRDKRREAKGYIEPPKVLRLWSIRKTLSSATSYSITVVEATM